MEFYQFIIQNKEIFKCFYALVVILINILIVIKADRFYKLSLHNGLRYFRNAFLFFGLAFASRYFLKFVFDLVSLYHIRFVSVYLFEFFLVVGGFFLLYSLLWRRFESPKPFSSLFNPITALFYVLALIIALIDLLWRFHYLLFISQIILFLYAVIISYSNYKRNRNTHKFPKFYFVAMILALVVWILNFLAAVVFSWDMVFVINIYILNSLFFLLFLYGLIKVVRG
jgi:hypothetical protein